MDRLATLSLNTSSDKAEYVICKWEQTQFCGNKGNDVLSLKVVEVEVISEDLQREAFMEISVGK